MLLSSLNCASDIDEETPPPKIITPSSDSLEVNSVASASSSVFSLLKTSSTADNSPTISES